MPKSNQARQQGTELVRVTAYLPKELAIRLRVQAALTGRTMSDIVTEILEKALPSPQNDL